MQTHTHTYVAAHARYLYSCEKSTSILGLARTCRTLAVGLCFVPCMYVCMYVCMYAYSGLVVH